MKTTRLKNRLFIQTVRAPSLQPDNIGLTTLDILRVPKAHYPINPIRSAAQCEARNTWQGKQTLVRQTLSTL